jgi:Cu/Ag efflux protein CusF
LIAFNHSTFEDFPVKNLSKGGAIGAIAAVVIALGGVAFAADHAAPADGSMHGMAHTMSDAKGGVASMPGVEGEVRRVDKAAGKVTLRHDEVRQHEMPAMTMAFPVSDKALLDKVKVGDKVRFKVVEQDGRMIVTELNPIR